MSMEKNIKEIIEELIQEVEQELEEATTTAGVDGYNTPFAFGANRKKDKKKEKDVATQAGYTIAESVNEYIEPQTKKIAYYTGTRPEAVKDFVSKHALNITKLLKYVEKGGLPQRMDFVSALAGRPNNPIQKKIIKMFSESVNEAVKPSQVRSSISKVKKELMRKWKQKGGYENFGQKELSQMKDKFDYNPYGTSDERQISKMLDGFDNWAMNYDGNMREGKKRFKRQDGIGKAKYTISYHDGKKKHKDGSDFFDIKIFKNKKDLSDFVGTLVKQGYKLTNESINESKVKRPVNRWLELKNDETMHAHKKMAMGLKELKYQLREVEKFFNWYNKIKTMNELDSQNYWKRTNNHIYTIKEKLINIAKTIQEIEK